MLKKLILRGSHPLDGVIFHCFSHCECEDTSFNHQTLFKASVLLIPSLIFRRIARSLRDKIKIIKNSAK